MEYEAADIVVLKSDTAEVRAVLGGEVFAGQQTPAYRYALVLEAHGDTYLNKGDTFEVPVSELDECGQFGVVISRDECLSVLQNDRELREATEAALDENLLLRFALAFSNKGEKSLAVDSYYVRTTDLIGEVEVEVRADDGTSVRLLFKDEESAIQFSDAIFDGVIF